MKARVIDINKDERVIAIDILDSNDKACLHTKVYCGSCIRICMYDYGNLGKARWLLVKNIGKIISKVFSISKTAFPLFDYDKREVESIVFESLVRWFILERSSTMEQILTSRKKTISEIQYSDSRIGISRARQ